MITKPVPALLGTPTHQSPASRTTPELDQALQQTQLLSQPVQMLASGEPRWASSKATSTASRCTPRGRSRTAAGHARRAVPARVHRAAGSLFRRGSAAPTHRGWLCQRGLSRDSGKELGAMGLRSVAGWGLEDRSGLTDGAGGLSCRTGHFGRRGSWRHRVRSGPAARLRPMRNRWTCNAGPDDFVADS